MSTPQKQKYKKYLLRDFDSRFFLTLKESNIPQLKGP